MAVKIGLSGGIGSGKSTVSKIFSQLDISTYNADQVARQLTEPGTAQYTEIIHLFGKDILDESTTINRSKLGDMIFSDPDKRQQLENILHPPIRRELFRLSENCDADYCILEIPLLFESHLYMQMQRTVTVNCDQEIRIQRLIRGRKKSRAFLEQLIQNQLTDEQRSALADDIIENNDAISELKQAVIALNSNYRLLFSSTTI